MTTDLEHTYGQKIDGVDKCPLCPGPHGGAGPCDRSRYTRQHRRFVLAHLEEFISAYTNPDKRYGANVLARLAREERTLPPRHICWCICPNVAFGRASCDLCKERQRDQKFQEPVALGRTGHVNAPMPTAEMLDLAAGLLAA